MKWSICHSHAGDAFKTLLWYMNRCGEIHITERFVERNKMEDVILTEQRHGGDILELEIGRVLRVQRWPTRRL
jgi:hypothetical protein